MSLLDDSDDLKRRRDQAAQQRAWQLRAGELVHERALTFFRTLVDEIEAEVNAFNEKFSFRPPTSGLAITRVGERRIILEKNDTPCLRQEMYLVGDAGPVVVNKTLTRHPRPEETTRRWHFGAKLDGEVYLDGKTEYACKTEFLSGIAELF